VTSFVVSTTTVTVTLSDITTDRIPVSNVNVTDGQTTGSFDLRPSFDIPDGVVTVTGQDGKPTPRSLKMPPYPDITNGPPESRNSSTSQWLPGRPNATMPSPSAGPGTTFTWTDEPWVTPPVVVACPPNTAYIAEHDAKITIQDCNGAVTLNWACPPTKTVKIEAPTETVFSLGCTLWTGTGTPLPTFTTWPPGELEWVEEDDDDDETHCDMWFFTVSVEIFRCTPEYPIG
jgi:hypothetical protein